MINQKTVNKQLKKIDFNPHGWNRSEVAELHQILLADEIIHECVNGIYEGGFALLVATDIRVLLVDKKPLNFLNVEDLRFDMINEIDYNHRMMGASIVITTGSKALNFRSYNKQRLRKLIGHVQHCMAENKKKQSTSAEDQKQHLEQINQQLQTYLMAQYQQQQKLQEHFYSIQKDGGNNSQPAKIDIPEPVKPSNELSDYLYAHGLMEKYREETGNDPLSAEKIYASPEPLAAETRPPQPDPQNSQLAEMYADGIQEVFGQRVQPKLQPIQSHIQHGDTSTSRYGLDPFKIAISKLPMVLRSRKFGLSLPSLPSFPTPFPHHTTNDVSQRPEPTPPSAVAKPA